MTRMVQTVLSWLTISFSLIPGVLAAEALNPSTGQFEQRPLSLDQLEQIALERSPVFALAARRIQALQGKHLQVGLYPNPTLGYQADEIGDEGRAGQQGIVVGQRIVRGGKLGWNRAVVSQEIVVAEQRLQMQRYRVISDVRAAGHEVIAAQRTLALSQQLVELGDDFLRTAEQLLAAREISRLDVLQASIEAKAARLRLERAQQSLEGQWQQLAAQIGVVDLAITPIEDDWDQYDLAPLVWEDELARLLNHSPEWLLAATDIERARTELASQCANRIADVELQGGVAYNFGSGDTIAALGIAVPLQLFDRNQGNILRARAELNAAYEEQQRVKLMLQRRLAEVFLRYENARATVSRYRKDILPDAREALNLVGQGFQQGEVGYLELLTVQRTFFQTSLDFVEAFRDLQVSRTRINNLLLSNALDEHVP